MHFWALSVDSDLTWFCIVEAFWENAYIHTDTDGGTERLDSTFGIHSRV